VKARPEPVRPGASAPANPRTEPENLSARAPENLKDALLAEIRAKKVFLYNSVIAQAQKIEVTPDRVTFTFLPAHRALREQLDLSCPWLEAAAERIAGRKMSVVAVQSTPSQSVSSQEIPAAASVNQGSPAAGDAPSTEKRDLKAEAMSSSTVQAMLDVFPAEIRDVEEM
jgi:hypothetical protein